MSFIKKNTIIIAFDRYILPLIKDNVRLLGDRVECNQFIINGPDQKLSIHFINELKYINFKDTLVKFLRVNWNKDRKAAFFFEKTININYEICYKYEVVDIKVIRTEEDKLACPDHEEMDTKIVYYVCKLGFDANVTIRCSDTDITVTMLGNFSKQRVTNLDIGGYWKRTKIYQRHRIVKEIGY